MPRHTNNPPKLKHHLLWKCEVTLFLQATFFKLLKSHAFLKVPYTVKVGEKCASVCTVHYSFLDRGELDLELIISANMSIIALVSSGAHTDACQCRVQTLPCSDAKGWNQRTILG